MGSEGPLRDHVLMASLAVPLPGVQGQVTCLAFVALPVTQLP